MAQQQRRRLTFVKTDDLELWRCRPIGSIPVMDLRDSIVGKVDGLIIEAVDDHPLFVVVRRDGEPAQRVLVPVGDAWFDDSEHAVRVDLSEAGRPAAPFDLDAFERMSHEEAARFEGTVLGRCCPEVGFHPDGTPNYARLAAFQCPSWLRPAAGTTARAHPAGSAKAK